MIKLREIHERDELLAWKERCVGKQTGVLDTVMQDRYIMASSYADEWTSSLYGNFRFWHICLALTGEWLYDENRHDTCRHVTLSKKWDTLHADPLACGQRWYCSCVAKYNATWGVLVEMKFNSEQGVRYFRADAPDDHVKGALAMHHEKTLGLLWHIIFGFQVRVPTNLSFASVGRFIFSRFIFSRSWANLLF